MWHVPLVTFQNSAAYISTFITLLLKMRIFVFLLIVFVFQMFFRAANAPLALLIILLFSASVLPSFVTLALRYVNSVASSVLFSESDCFCCLTVVSHGFGFAFVNTNSHFCCILTSLSVLLCMSLWLCACRDVSSAKSRSANDHVNVHMIPLLTVKSVLVIIQYIARQNRNGDNIHPCFTPVFSCQTLTYHICLESFIQHVHCLAGDSVYRKPFQSL